MWTNKNRARYDASCSENSAIRPEVSGQTLRALSVIGRFADCIEARGLRR
jgi:hypothetical protein